MAEEPTPTPDGGKGSDEEPKTLTQEQVDKIVETRLAREREKQQKERDEEKQRIEDEKKSEIEKLASRITAAEKRAQEAEEKVNKAELDALRVRIGKAADLPDALAELLQGSNEDELKEHAARLKESIGGPKPPPTQKPKPKAVQNGSDDDKPTSNDAINDWIRSQAQRG